MLRSILLGLDGSTYSNAAVELGIRWAKRFDAVLTGMGIVDEPSLRRPEPVPLGAGHVKHMRNEELRETARRRVGEYLDLFVDRCEAAGATYNLLEVGMSYHEVLRQSQRFDLVLLGHQTHFEFGAEDRPDQTVRSVLRHTSRPVVAVPERLEGGQGVVIAYNGRREADLALQAFRNSGLDFGETVHVLSMDPDASWASRCARHAAEYLQQQGIVAAAQPMKQSYSAGRAIVEQARRKNARLIVMGAYGRSTLREFLFGSVTDTVIAESPVPIFLCH